MIGFDVYSRILFGSIGFFIVLAAGALLYRIVGRLSKRYKIKKILKILNKLSCNIAFYIFLIIFLCILAAFFYALGYFGFMILGW